MLFWLNLPIIVFVLDCERLILKQQPSWSKGVKKKKAEAQLLLTSVDFYSDSLPRHQFLLLQLLL